ncbi:MAG: hypothetical protein LC650_04020 [Actinobacteria bacterium]|nr:hypothetical protein [Actinomycetota bacterium]
MMTVDKLIDELTARIIDGELTGKEQVVDTGLYAVSGLQFEPMYDGSVYVVLTSEEQTQAQSA